ncbi:hypothetical protein L208DRAFT_1388611 [Tricholoma matsutake]|nr:hypothetical protein L208DRAFT_1388611 [Tricholoma matsutake 945]
MVDRRHVLDHTNGLLTRLLKADPDGLLTRLRPFGAATKQILSVLLTMLVCLRLSPHGAYETLLVQISEIAGNLLSLSIVRGLRDIVDYILLCTSGFSKRREAR